MDDSDTYIQNSARFVNAGTVLNDSFSYFKLDSASTLENSGSFENKNTLKIVNSFVENTGYFKNSASVEVNSGSLHNNAASTSIVSSGGTMTIINKGEFYNESGDIDISGCMVDMNGLRNFVNSSTVDFSGSSVLKIRNEVRDASSERRLALSNSGTLRFIGSAKLEISDGAHSNTGEIDVCDNDVFSMSGGYFTNSAKVNFSDTSSFSVSGETFKNLSTVTIHSSARMDLTGGFATNSDVKFENDGAFTISGSGVFSNLNGAVFANRGNVSMSDGTFENRAEFNFFKRRFGDKRGRFQELRNRFFQWGLSLLGGEFEQSSTANFANFGTTTIDSVFKFGVDRTNLAGAVNNAFGIIDIGQNAAFKVVMDEDFADGSIANLEIVLIFGGEVNDKYGIVMNAVALEWEDGTSANSDFVWSTVFENGNLKVLITSHVSEAADTAFFAGVFAVLISVCRRKIRSAAK